MLNLSLDGFDKLQRDLENARHALASLDGTIATLRFNPSDAASVLQAIQQMEVAVDSKVASYGSSPLVASMVQAAKDQYREQILKLARESG